jgi:hypothetical protein
MLVIGILGLLAAALAAWFAYPAWKAYRAKPDLRLVINQGPPTSALVMFRLQNEGDGAAADWIVTIETSRGRFIPMGSGDVQGWSDRQTPPGWTTTWLSGGPSDAIGPGLHREFPVAPSSGRMASASTTRNGQ